RLATSKYASTGDGSGSARAASATISSRGEAPVGGGRTGLLTIDHRPFAFPCRTPARVGQRAADQRERGAHGAAGAARDFGSAAESRAVFDVNVLDPQTGTRCFQQHFHGPPVAHLTHVQ